MAIENRRITFHFKNRERRRKRSLASQCYHRHLIDNRDYLLLLWSSPTPKSHKYSMRIEKERWELSRVASQFFSCSTICDGCVFFFFLFFLAWMQEAKLEITNSLYRLLQQQATTMRQLQLMRYSSRIHQKRSPFLLLFCFEFCLLLFRFELDSSTKIRQKKRGSNNLQDDSVSV